MEGYVKPSPPGHCHRGDKRQGHGGQGSHPYRRQAAMTVATVRARMAMAMKRAMSVSCYSNECRERYQNHYH